MPGNVTIEIDADASSATGTIGGVISALGTLKATAAEVGDDFDFEDAVVGVDSKIQNATKSLDKFDSKLGEIDDKMSNIKAKNKEMFDGDIEVDVTHSRRGGGGSDGTPSRTSTDDDSDDGIGVPGSVSAMRKIKEKDPSFNLKQFKEGRLVDTLIKAQPGKLSNFSVSQKKNLQFGDEDTTRFAGIRIPKSLSPLSGSGPITGNIAKDSDFSKSELEQVREALSDFDLPSSTATSSDIEATRRQNLKSLAEKIAATNGFEADRFKDQDLISTKRAEKIDSELDRRAKSIFSNVGEGKEYPAFRLEPSKREGVESETSLGRGPIKRKSVISDVNIRRPDDLAERMRKATRETDSYREAITRVNNNLSDFYTPVTPKMDMRRAANLDNFGETDSSDAIINEDRKRGLKSITGLFKRMRPTIGNIYNIIATLIPIIIVLGAQLLGVAAAMGAVAAAGASVIGLGLLGHADSLSGSLSEAKQEASELGSELFEVFQPTAQQFAPIQAKAFDRVPDAIQPIAEEMEGLVAYEDTLFELGGMLAEGMAFSLDKIVENEEAISQLALRFTQIAGKQAASFGSFIFEEAKESQDALIQLASALKVVARFLFQILDVIVLAVTAFSPFVYILNVVASLMENDWVKSASVFILTIYLLVAAFAKLTLSIRAAYLSMLKGNSIMLKSAVAAYTAIQTKLKALAAQYMSTAAAASAAHVAMGAIGALSLGLGAFAVKKGVGPLPSASGSNSPTDFGAGNGGGLGRGTSRVYNDNRTYNIESGSNAALSDVKGMGESIRNDETDREGTQLPDVDTGK